MLTGVSGVLAHGLEGHASGSADVAVLVGVAVCACCALAVYTRGLRRLLRHRQGRRHRWRAVAFYAGVGITLAVSLPPFGEWLEERLSTHMLQHVVFIMVSAPLLALASPGQPVLAGLPRILRRRAVSVARALPLGILLAPTLAWSVQVAALWMWHLPGAYDAALRSEWVHGLEHLCFLGSAWLFWWHIATTSWRRLRGPVAMLYVVASMLPGAALGAVLVFASHPLYPAQAQSAAAHGSDPMLDQQIGGIVMWVPLDYVYLALAIALFAQWFRLRQPAGVQLPQDATARAVAPAEGEVRA